MPRRRTLKDTKVVHPENSHVLRVRCMSDGGFDIIIENPARGVRRMAWAMGGLFTGGKTGTRMRLFELDVTALDE